MEPGMEKTRVMPPARGPGTQARRRRRLKLEASLDSLKSPPLGYAEPKCNLTHVDTRGPAR